MKILIGCEESQAVCIAFRELGHEAYSCDLKPCSGGHPEWHLQMDIFEALASKKWAAFIVFPDCTFVTVSGLHWNKRISGRSQKTEEALQFVCRLWNVAKRQGIKKMAMENPIGCISTRIIKDFNGNLIVLPFKQRGNGGGYLFKPSQIIQPYQFGEDASKATCLWIKGLPLLTPTQYFEPRIVDGKKRWGNQTNSGQNKLGPSEDRAEKRSKTYPGIAKAMAIQWGSNRRRYKSS